MKIRQIIWMTIIGLVITAGSFMAFASEGPEKIVKDTLTEITHILNNNAMNQGQKRSQIVKSVKPLFDLPLMAKLTLGRKHWSALSNNKKQEFTSLFSAHLEKAYIGKVELYTNDKIDFKPAVQKDNKIYVPTELISKGKVVPITYKFYQSKQGWKIYDAEISGTSVIVSHQAEYSAILNNGSIDDLLAKLKQSLK